MTGCVSSIDGGAVRGVDTTSGELDLSRLAKRNWNHLRTYNVRDIDIGSI